jgi:hypothetical protein
MTFSQMYAGYLAYTDYFALQTFNVQVNTNNGTVLNQIVYALSNTSYYGTSGVCGAQIWKQGACVDPQAVPAPYYTPYFIVLQNPIGPVCPTCTCSTLGSTASLWGDTSQQFVQFMNQNSGLYICGYFTQSSPLANLFVANSITTSSLTPQQLAAFSASITSQFQSDQQQIYGEVAFAFQGTTPVATNGQLLSGAKLLAQAYASFGLPGSMQTNDVLHALLYGNGSILDASAVQSDFAGFNMSTISNTTDDKITDEIGKLSSGSAALAAAFNGALTQIQANGTPDSLVQVDTTLEDLQAFETLKNANALSPCTFQLSSTVAVVSTTGGAVNVGVQGPTACQWRASTGASWLAATSGQTGSGPGTITFVAGQNTSGSSRAAVVIIGDQVLEVIQP